MRTTGFRRGEDRRGVLKIKGERSDMTNFLLEFLSKDVKIRESIDPKRNAVDGIEIEWVHTEPSGPEDEPLENMQVAELQEKAARLGIAVDGRWGYTRLITEIRKHGNSDE